MIIKLRADQLEHAMKNDGKRVDRARAKAAMRAAQRTRTLLIKRSNEADLVDTGAYKNGWRASRTDGGAIVYNDAPYAGIIEMGARPHKVSKEGIEAIARWVARKLGVSGPTDGSVTFLGRTVKGGDQAMAIAYAIAQKIKQCGQKPHWIARDALDDARGFYADAFAEVMNESQGDAAP